jgi:hypothetical protein
MCVTTALILGRPDDRKRVPPRVNSTNNRNLAESVAYRAIAAHKTAWLRKVPSSQHLFM